MSRPVPLETLSSGDRFCTPDGGWKAELVSVNLGSATIRKIEAVTVAGRTTWRRKKAIRVARSMEVVPLKKS